MQPGHCCSPLLLRAPACWSTAPLSNGRSQRSRAALSLVPRICPQSRILSRCSCSEQVGHVTEGECGANEYFRHSPDIYMHTNSTALRFTDFKRCSITPTSSMPLCDVRNERKTTKHKQTSMWWHLLVWSWRYFAQWRKRKKIIDFDSPQLCGFLQNTDL